MKFVISSKLNRNGTCDMTSCLELKSGFNYEVKSVTAVVFNDNNTWNEIMLSCVS